MLTPNTISLLQYRAELRETIPERDLALLDANLPKSIFESCCDMGILLKHLDVMTVRGIEYETLLSLAAHGSVNWNRKHDAPRCFQPTADILADIQSALHVCETLWCYDEEEKESELPF